jgi:hypothetical protein
MGAWYIHIPKKHRHPLKGVGRIEEYVHAPQNVQNLVIIRSAGGRQVYW